MKYLIVLFSLLLFSCNDNVRYQEYVSLPQGWHKDKPVLFRYEVNDTISKHNIFIYLRNDKNYPYSNIFLITKMETPQDKMITDTLEYEMATPEGKWLGNGASVKESKLWYKEGVRFPKKGVYFFAIEQADRSIGQNEGVQNLKGITEVGLSIEVNK